MADRLLSTTAAPFAAPGTTADSLLAAADAALYESKRAGGRRWTLA